MYILYIHLLSKAFEKVCADNLILTIAKRVSPLAPTPTPQIPTHES